MVGAGHWEGIDPSHRTENLKNGPVGDNSIIPVPRVSHTQMKAIILFVFALLSLGSCFATGAGPDCGTRFQDFKSRFGRSYQSAEEEHRRYVIFCDNLERANTFNGADTATFGVTKFSDLTVAEVTRMYLNYKPRGRQAGPVVQPSSSPVTLDSFDWRDHGAVTQVRDQGQCGSCWAFSAVEEVESCWARKNGTLAELSPQQVVSCDQGKFDMGCDGGDTVMTYVQYISAYGLQTESDYPYTSGTTGQDGPCLYNKSQVAVRVKGFEYATTPCFHDCARPATFEDTLLKNLQKFAPVSICVCVDDKWFSYTGGVLSTNSSYAYPALNHCTQLVGYGTDTGGKYWIMRNSWGKDWGVDGYMYLRYGLNLCGLTDEATFVTF